ncbi:MAG: ROK family protein [Thermoanaerobacteraceae bacterium]|nr:ROK family protein [Thermoanaerobacteraceae bacterium]
MNCAIGIDLGGTKTAIGLVNENGEIISREMFATEGPEKTIEEMGKSIDRMIEKVGIIEGIGIGSPGPIDSKKGIVVCPPNLPEWRNIPLADILSHKYKVKVMLNNDANVAALGEWLFGAGRGVQNFIYITVSTGIGGGAVLNGRFYEGENANALEVGHATIDYKGPRCGCGNYGCFEAMASGTALARFAREAIKERRDSILAGYERIRAEDVFEAAKMGDALAVKLVDDEALYLGVGLTNVINSFNPGMIAIGGGVSKAWDMYYEKMMQVIKERALPTNYEVVQVVRAKLGEDIGIVGAASLVYNLSME